MPGTKCGQWQSYFCLSVEEANSPTGKTVIATVTHMEEKFPVQGVPWTENFSIDADWICILNNGPLFMCLYGILNMEFVTGTTGMPV